MEDFAIEQLIGCGIDEFTSVINDLSDSNCASVIEVKDGGGLSSAIPPGVSVKITLP